MKALYRIINYLENEEIPFFCFCLSFLFIIICRQFFEGFTQASVNFFNALPVELMYQTIHYNLSYISGFSSLILLMHYSSRTELKKVARIVLAFSILLFIAPTVDLINTWGKGADIHYLPYNTPLNISQVFFPFFYHYKAITLGLKVEIWVSLIAIYLYFILKGLGYIKSLLGMIAAYALIFAYFYCPMILKTLLHLVHIPFNPYDLLYIRSYALLIFISGMWTAYVVAPKTFKIILKDARISRILFYILMVAAGFCLALHQSSAPLLAQIKYYHTALIDFILISISLFFAGLFSIITNNIADKELDTINGLNRPLVNNSIPPALYLKIAYYCLFLSLCYALSTGFKAFFMVLFVISTYYLYSMPPIRFKRFLILSKLTVSASALSLFILGYLWVQNNLFLFPKSMYVFFLINITLSANFIDIKDIKGDKTMGIYTLPALIGLKKAKLMVGLFFMMNYLAIAYLFQAFNLWPLFTSLGLIAFYLVNKRNYQDKAVLYFILLSIILILGLLFSFPTLFHQI